MKSRIRRGIIPLYIYLLYYFSKVHIKGELMRVNIDEFPLVLPVKIPLVLFLFFLTTIMISKLFDDIDLYFNIQSEKEYFVWESGITTVTIWLVFTKIITTRFILISKAISWDEWTKLAVQNLKLTPINVDTVMKIITLGCVVMMLFPTNKMYKRIGEYISECLRNEQKNYLNAGTSWNYFFYMLYFIRFTVLFIIIESLAGWNTILYTFVMCFILFIYVPKARELEYCYKQIDFFCRDFSIVSGNRPGSIDEKGDQEWLDDWKRLKWENRKRWIAEYASVKSESEKQKEELQACRDENTALKVFCNDSIKLIYSIVQDKVLANDLMAIINGDKEIDIDILATINQVLMDYDNPHFVNYLCCSHIVHCQESILKGLINKLLMIADYTRSENTDLTINAYSDEENGKVCVEIKSAIKYELVEMVNNTINVYSNTAIDENEHYDEIYFNYYLVAKTYANLIKTAPSICIVDNQLLSIVIDFYTTAISNDDTENDRLEIEDISEKSRISALSEK